MKHIIKMSIVLLAGIVFLASCRKEFEYRFADHGPDVVVNSCSETAYMGSVIEFSVNISDPEFALSTLKAELYFDADVVGEVTLRTKEQGTYEGEVPVPILAGIPDGTAAVVFTGTNVGQGRTVLEPVEVSVVRPDFEYLTLKMENGQEYRMDRTAKYSYSVTQSFPVNANAMIEAPAISEGEEPIVFGWNGTGIEAGAEGNIPFSNGVAGEYTVSFNTLTFEGEPFVVLTVNDVETTMIDNDTYEAVLDLTQGQTVTVDGYAAGFDDWTIDRDWFETVSSGEYRFLAVDGKYKIIIELDNKFFRVEAMKSDTELATLNSDGTGAVWLIGDANVGKPTMSQGASWSPELGGLCLAQVEPKKYQITLVAGLNILTDKVDFKFFHQKTWVQGNVGGEFGGGTITSQSALFVSGESDGNIHVADGQVLQQGGVYKFVLDLSEATWTPATAETPAVMSGAILTVQQDGVEEIPQEEISINGTQLEMSTPGVYSADIDLTQNGAITITGVDNLAEWYIDPDYLRLEGTSLLFNAVSGKYEVTLNTNDGYATFARLNDAGAYATFSEGGLYLMGYGVGHPSVGAEIGWTTEIAYSMAQVEPGVYQFTGVAMPEKDQTVGGRFRMDYISMKYFGQKGWGNEKGTINGQTNTVQYTEAAQQHFNNPGGDNMGFETSETEKHLEQGATYRLTIDLTGLGDHIEKIDFVKVQ